MTGRRVGLFGGSFNPPHNGHVSAARRAHDALALHSIVVMPAGTPPHKELPPGTPPKEARLEMARLAFTDVPGCAVSDWEMKRPAPAYTADTLEWLRGNGYHPILVVGSDMFLTLHEWTRAEDILTSIKVAVLARARGLDEQVSRQAAFLAHRYHAAIEWIPHEPIAISSTELRAMLGAGRGWEYLPGPVSRYIRKKKFYGVTD